MNGDIMVILIIDKEKRWANHVKQLLEKDGHQVEILEEYENAMEYTRKKKVNLVFYDSKLFKKKQKLASELIMQNPNIRLIVTSALPNYKDAMSARRYGAVDYIDKLYDHNELNNIIAENMKNTPVSREYLKQVLKEEEVCQ